MGSVRASEMTFTETERVTMGRPAREAIRDQAEKMGARRVFILASDTLRTKTDEIAAIERELGERHAADRKSVV